MLIFLGGLRPFLGFVLRLVLFLDVSQRVYLVGKLSGKLVVVNGVLIHLFQR